MDGMNKVSPYLVTHPIIIFRWSTKIKAVFSLAIPKEEATLGEGRGSLAEEIVMRKPYK